MLESSQIKEFGDNNFKLNENDGKYSKSIENTGRRNTRITCYEQFLLFSQSVQKTCTEDR